MAGVAPVILGFCKFEVNAFGPVQEYVTPETAAVVKLIVDPLQTGLLVETAGVETEFTTTVVVAETKHVAPGKVKFTV